MTFLVPHPLHGPCPDADGRGFIERQGKRPAGHPLDDHHRGSLLRALRIFIVGIQEQRPRERSQKPIHSKIQYTHALKKGTGSQTPPPRARQASHLPGRRMVRGRACGAPRRPEHPRAPPDRRTRTRRHRRGSRWPGSVSISYLYSTGRGKWGSRSGDPTCEVIALVMQVCSAGRALKGASLLNRGNDALVERQRHRGDV